MFCPRFSEKFPFSFYLFKNALKPQKSSVFSRQKENLFINTTLLQVEQRLVPNSYLRLKCEIVFFKRYIQVFFATELF